MERAIKTNKESTKCLLQQKKFKKFNTLKHKLQTSHRETNIKENGKRRQIRTTANALVQGLRRRSPSQENKQKTGRDQSPNVTSRKTSANDLSNEEPVPIEKKIQFLNLNKGKRTRAKSPTRSHSKTNYTQKTNKQNNKVNETEGLKKEIAQFKQNQNDELRNKETKTNDQNDHSKNLQEASNNGGQKQSSIKTEVMNFIQQTMATLENYNEQLKQNLNKDTTHMGG